MWLKKTDNPPPPFGTKMTDPGQSGEVAASYQVIKKL